LADTKTRPKLSKQLYKKALSHGVSILMQARNTKNTNFSQGDLLADEVDVNLNMLHLSMMNRIGCHIDSTNIFTINKCQRNGNGGPHNPGLMRD